MQGRLFTQPAPVDIYSAHLPDKLYSYLQSNNLLDGAEHTFKSKGAKISHTISVKTEQILMTEEDLNCIKEETQRAIKTGDFSDPKPKAPQLPDSVIIEIQDHGKHTINSYAFIKRDFYRGMLIEDNIPFQLDPASLILLANLDKKVSTKCTPELINNFLIHKVMSELKEIILPENKLKSGPESIEPTPSSTPRFGCSLQ